MPYKSKKQARWAFANKKPWAKRWADVTDFSSLPEKAMQFGGYGQSLADALAPSEPAQEEFTTPMVERAMQTRVGEQPLATGAIEPSYSDPITLGIGLMGPAAGPALGGRFGKIAGEVLDAVVNPFMGMKSMYKDPVKDIKSRIAFVDEYLDMVDKGLPGKQMTLNMPVREKNAAMKKLKDEYIERLTKRGVSKTKAEEAARQMEFDFSKKPYNPVAYDEDAIPRGKKEMAGFNRMMQYENEAKNLGVPRPDVPFDKAIRDRMEAQEMFPGDSPSYTGWLIGKKNKEGVMSAFEATTPKGYRKSLKELGFNKQFVDEMNDDQVSKLFQDYTSDWFATLFDRQNMDIGNALIRGTLPERAKSFNELGGMIPGLQSLAPQSMMQMPGLPGSLPMMGGGAAGAAGAAMGANPAGLIMGAASGAMNLGKQIFDQGTAADKYGKRSVGASGVSSLMGGLASGDPMKMVAAPFEAIGAMINQGKQNKEAAKAKTRDVISSMKGALEYEDPVKTTYEGQQMNTFSKRGGRIPYPYQSQMRRGIQPAVAPTRFLTHGGDLLKEVFDDDYFEDYFERETEPIVPRGQGHQTFMRGGNMLDLAFHPKLYKMYSAPGKPIVPRGQGFQTFQQGGNFMEGIEEREIPAEGGGLQPLSDNAYMVQGNQPGKTDDVGLGNGAYVDHGEFIKDGQVNMQVFSDTLKPPGSKKTFAEVAKDMEKQKPKNPDDPRFQGQVALVERKLQELFAMQQIMNGDSDGESPAEAEAGMPMDEEKGRGITLGNAFNYGGLYAGTNPVDETEFFNLQNLPDWRKKKKSMQVGGEFNPIQMQTQLNKTMFEHPKTGKPINYWDYKQEILSDPSMGKRDQRTKFLNSVGERLRSGEIPNIDIDQYQTEPGTQMPGMEGLNSPKKLTTYAMNTGNYYHGGVGDKLSDFHPELAGRMLPTIQDLYPNRSRLPSGPSPSRMLARGGKTGQLKMGIPVEAEEHHKSMQAAKTIAMQHLAEDPQYYTKLKKAGLQFGGSIFEGAPGYDEELHSEPGHGPGSGTFSHGGILDALGDDVYMLFGVEEPHNSHLPAAYKSGGSLSKEYIKKARKRPGGSNVGKKKFASGKKRTGPYAGPSGGAPKGSYPIPDISHARSALRLAGHAPNPAGIRAKVYRKYPQFKKAARGALLEDPNIQDVDYTYGFGPDNSNITADQSQAAFASQFNVEPEVNPVTAEDLNNLQNPVGTETVAREPRSKGPDYWTQFLPDAANLLNILTLPKVPNYSMAKKQKLNKFDNRDVVNKIMQSERAAGQTIQDNMSQQGAAAANLQGLHSGTINMLSSEAQKLRTLNNQVQNAQAQLDQQIEALNTGTRNRQKEAELNRLLTQRKELSALAANVGSKIAGIQQEKNLMRKDALALDLYSKLYGIPGVWGRKMESPLDRWERTSGVKKARDKVKKTK